MEGKNKKRLMFWLKMGLGLLIIIVILNLSITITDIEADRDYYKDQMLNLCELAHLQHEILLEFELINSSDLKVIMGNSCDSWILENLDDLILE